jgi:tetratricopeptide (TPR) repeat protein
MGQAERAIPYFERYASAATEDPNAHDSLGEGYFRAGRLADAAREYEKAVALNPTFSNSFFMLGQVYQQLGEGAKAAAAYRRFLDLSPDGPQADEARAALPTLTAE